MLGWKLIHVNKRGIRYSNMCKVNSYSGDLILLSIFAKPQFCFSKMQNLAVSVKCRTWLQTCENKHEDTPDITSVCLWDCNIHLGRTATRNNWAGNQHLDQHHISKGINFCETKEVIRFCSIHGYDFIPVRRDLQIDSDPTAYCPSPGAAVCLPSSILSPQELGYLWPLLLTWFNFNPSMDK